MMLAAQLFYAGAVVLRIATVAPDGTMWAREMKAMAHEVEAATRGGVRLKWYWGGIAGDEAEVESRILREQLEGTASGGQTCLRHAPSLRVMRIPGLFSSRDEAHYVIGALRKEIDEEFRRAGFVNLSTLVLGTDIVFLRGNAHSLAELRRLRLWRWDSDDPAIGLTRAMGIPIIPTAISQAGAALDAGEVDGLIAIPAAVLAFQWYGRLKSFIDFPFSQVSACVIVTQRAFAKLPHEHQQALLAAGAKLRARSEIVVRDQDDALTGGLFERQGLKRMVLSDSERGELLEAARASRQRLDETKIPHPLLERVLTLLADWRLEHRK